MSFNNVLVSCVKYALDNMDLSLYNDVEIPDKNIKKINLLKEAIKPLL